MDDKTFYYYFKENMEATGLPCPETIFGVTTTAVTNIGLLAAYVAKNHGVTIGKMLKDIPTIAAAGAAVAVADAAVSVAGVSTVVSEGSIATIELSAAFYVGACIGSLLVATVKSGSDLYTRTAGNRAINKPVFYKVHDISKFAKQYKIEMSSEVQKVLHRYPKLRQCH